MPDPQFRPGDLVTLKSGSPLLTVESYSVDDQPTVCVAWFDADKHLHSGNVPEACLHFADRRETRDESELHHAVTLLRDFGKQISLSPRLEQAIDTIIKIVLGPSSHEDKPLKNPHWRPRS